MSPAPLRDLLPRIAAARPAEAARVREWLGDEVRAVLSPREALTAPVREALTTALPALDALEDALVVAANRFDPGPFRPEMTVHAAHFRHPGVRAIFAARGLPGCPDCPVGADESLAEAAHAEGLVIEELLGALRGLEGG